MQDNITFRTLVSCFGSALAASETGVSDNSFPALFITSAIYAYLEISNNKFKGNRKIGMHLICWKQVQVSAIISEISKSKRSITLTKL